MFDLLKNILQFVFTVALVITANYVMVVGFRDLFAVLSNAVKPKGRRKPMVAGNMTAVHVVKRALFWLLVCAVSVMLIRFILQILAIFAGVALLFRFAEKNGTRPGRVAMFTALIMAVVTAQVVRSQPVLMKIESQFSIDLWIYNAANSLLDFMMGAAMRVGMDTSGIEHMAALVPYVQENMFVLLALSIYVLCMITLGGLVKMVLPDVKYPAPVYYRLSPEKYFLPAAVLALAYGWYFHMPQLWFVVGGVYYIWGVNLLVFALRGGWWPLNMLFLFAGVMNPALTVIFIVLGVLDNILDFRRAAGMLAALGSQD